MSCVCSFFAFFAILCFLRICAFNFAYNSFSPQFRSFCVPFLFFCQVLDFLQVVLYRLSDSLGFLRYTVDLSVLIRNARSRWRFQPIFIPLGTILGVDESHCEVVSNDSKNWAATWCRRHTWCKTIENKRTKERKKQKKTIGLWSAVLLWRVLCLLHQVGAKNWGTNRREVVMALSIDIKKIYFQKNKPDLSLSNVWIWSSHSHYAADTEVFNLKCLQPPIAVSLFYERHDICVGLFWRLRKSFRPVFLFPDKPRFWFLAF